VTSFFFDTTVPDRGAIASGLGDALGLIPTFV